MTKIIKLTTYDLRFPTSDNLDGSDAMNPDPDYSAAYVILETENKLLQGHSFAFTLGRGNDLCCEAIQALQHIVLGLDIEWIKDNLSSFSRMMTSDTQLRWVGPEKGIIHMASGAIINAVWDILSKLNNKPLWKQVSDMSPEEIAEMLFRALMNADEAMMAAMARAAVTQFAGMEPGRPVGGTYYLYRTLRNLDLDGMLDRLMEQAQERSEGAMTSLQERLEREEFENRIEDLKREIEAEIRRRLVADVQPDRPVQHLGLGRGHRHGR